MPEVNTSDLRDLLNDSLKKACHSYKETHKRDLIGITEQFYELIAQIEETVSSTLSIHTIYKLHYIKLKNHTEPRYHCSQYYLNAISSYYHGKPYQEVYKVYDKSEHQSADISVYVSYCSLNEVLATELKTYLAKKFTVHDDVRDYPESGSLQSLVQRLKENDIVIKLVTPEYLRSEYCMKDLIGFLDDEHDMLDYQNEIIHLIYDTTTPNHLDLFTSESKLIFYNYWHQKYKKLDGILQTSGAEPPHNPFIEELHFLKDIQERIIVFLNILQRNESTQTYDQFFLKEKGIQNILRKIDEKEASIQKRLQETYKSIQIPSKNNPENPEFPPANCQYPATPTIHLPIDGFPNVFMKDESINPYSGTHKDRLAWEVVAFYKEFLKINRSNPPSISIITSGSTGIAIQLLLRHYKLPPLKVLVDTHLDKSIKQALKTVGCEVYTTHLQDKKLSSDNILQLTDNAHGIDITYREMLDPTCFKYYDWLSYEILIEQPDYCFIPVGSGDLYHNVLNIYHAEFHKHTHDRRLLDRPVQFCHFIGGNTDNPKSKLTKLFSRYAASSFRSAQHLIDTCKEHGLIGGLSGIHHIQEIFVDPALSFANEHKITCEPSGISGLALFYQMKDQLDPKKKVLIVNTGKLRLPTF